MLKEAFCLAGCKVNCFVSSQQLSEFEILTGFLPNFVLKSIFEIWPMIGTYCLPTRRREVQKKLFHYPFLLENQNFGNTWPSVAAGVRGLKKVHNFSLINPLASPWILFIFGGHDSCTQHNISFEAATSGKINDPICWIDSQNQGSIHCSSTICKVCMCVCSVAPTIYDYTRIWRLFSFS